MISKARSAILRALNAAVATRACGFLDGDRVPSYIVVTPQLTHLAPLAARNNAPRIQPVFVANGIAEGDRAWLERLCPAVPIVPLRASFRSGTGSLLEHGVVVEHLARATRQETFCIQDADCFVSDAAFWNSVSLNPGSDYASGPFARKADGATPEIPQTFLVCINRALMERLRREYGITATASASPRGRAREILDAAGFPKGIYPEKRKNYFDTLQQYWIAAGRKGFRFRCLGGEGELVHHIGGTSYLYRTFDDLAHWDYWPLNVHYFHLRLLELPGCERFRDRFRKLIEFHGDSTALLATHPDFATGRRRLESDLILERMGADSVYGPVDR